MSCVIPEVFSDQYIKARKLIVNQNIHMAVQELSTKAAKKLGKWTEIRLLFDSKVQWVNELTVKYFVLVRDAKGQEILYGDITYLNVPNGKAHMASIFIHPATMSKYRKILSVHCEIWAEGKLRDVADIPKRPAKKWWEMKPPLKGLLISKFYTPFALNKEYDILPIKVEK